MAIFYAYTANEHFDLLFLPSHDFHKDLVLVFVLLVNTQCSGSLWVSYNDWNCKAVKSRCRKKCKGAVLLKRGFSGKNAEKTHCKKWEEMLIHAQCAGSHVGGYRTKAGIVLIARL